MFAVKRLHFAFDQAHLLYLCCTAGEYQYLNTIYMVQGCLYAFFYVKQSAKIIGISDRLFKINVFKSMKNSNLMLFVAGKNKLYRETLPWTRFSEQKQILNLYLGKQLTFLLWEKNM